MKKFFYWLIVLFFISCSDSSEGNITISKKEYNLLKGDSIALQYPKTFYVKGRSYKIELGSDRHEYYFILDEFKPYPFHYPECVLCKNQLKNETTSNKN